MTATVVRHPLINKCVDNLRKRLEALELSEGESVLMVRIVVRDGVPRKVKWTREYEECFN